MFKIAKEERSVHTPIYYFSTFHQRTALHLFPPSLLSFHENFAPHTRHRIFFLFSIPSFFYSLKESTNVLNQTSKPNHATIINKGIQKSGKLFLLVFALGGICWCRVFLAKDEEKKNCILRLRGLYWELRVGFVLIQVASN